MPLSARKFGCRAQPSPVSPKPLTVSLDASPAWLRRDRVDIFHLHNAVTAAAAVKRSASGRCLMRCGAGLRAAAATRQASLSRADLRWRNLSAPAVIDGGAFDSAQQGSCTTCSTRPPRWRCRANYPAQDYGRLFDHTKSAGPRRSPSRALAGGALSGSADRHLIASPPPDPIGSALNYDTDIARARRLMPLVTEGFAASLTEAATRFAITQPAVGTILVGVATPQQLRGCACGSSQNALPAAALDRLTALRQGFSGEAR